jgi:hypothetical protein
MNVYNVNSREELEELNGDILELKKQDLVTTLYKNVFPSKMSQSVCP